MDHFRRSLRNGLAGGGLDRVAHRRRDPQWVASRFRDPDTGFLAEWRGRHLCVPGPAPEPVLLSGLRARRLLGEAESQILLGQKDGRSFVTLGLPAAHEEVPGWFAGLGEFRGLREVAPLVGAEAAALLAYSGAMTHWHRRHRFCGDCGSPTEAREAGHLRQCSDPRCVRQTFPRTDPAIIVLVTRGDCCLLGRQGRWPAGMYSTLAGFLEPGETLEACVVREVREETGVRVDEVTYQSSQPWPFPASVMVGFRAKAVSDEVRLEDEELEDARWFTRRELLGGAVRLPSSYSIAFRLIDDWLREGGSRGTAPA